MDIQQTFKYKKDEKKTINTSLIFRISATEAANVEKSIKNLKPLYADKMP